MCAYGYVCVCVFVCAQGGAAHSSELNSIWLTRPAEQSTTAPTDPTTHSFFSRSVLFVLLSSIKIAYSCTKRRSRDHRAETHVQKKNMVSLVEKLLAHPLRISSRSDTRWLLHPMFLRPLTRSN